MRATLLDQSYLRYGIRGGVDFQKENQYAREAGVARPLFAALSARPVNSKAWTFSYTGKRYAAAAFRIKTPVPVGRQVMIWQRISILLPQPDVSALNIPDGYIRGLSRLDIVNNDSTSAVFIIVNGPTQGMFAVRAGANTAIGVKPGLYQINATASCGARKDSLSLVEGSRNVSSYSCRVVHVR
jgi:hypothetical protein